VRQSEGVDLAAGCDAGGLLGWDASTTSLQITKLLQAGDAASLSTGDGLGKQRL